MTRSPDPGRASRERQAQCRCAASCQMDVGQEVDDRGGGLARRVGPHADGRGQIAAVHHQFDRTGGQVSVEGHTSGAGHHQRVGGRGGDELGMRAAKSATWEAGASPKASPALTPRAAMAAGSAFAASTR